MQKMLLVELGLIFSTLREYMVDMRIGERPDHQGMLQQCKRISVWLHNHGQLNAVMRRAIDGELIKWNATRFGINYMFLESIYRKCEGFMQWMASLEFM
jgi:hypothetical protein